MGMRYKGIELIEGSEAELGCYISNTQGVEDINDIVDELFENSDEDVYLEEIDENLYQVRCDDIAFDKKGLSLLKRIYDLLRKDKNFDVTVFIHVDANEWFKDETDHEYNEDVVTWDEFIKNLEM